MTAVSPAGIATDRDQPALKQLLEDIDAHRIDCVVVYKVDRLSLSLLDFARLVDRFDQRSVSFVSVTQQFNTTSSLGRLTLNILLSFTQFEREIIGERTRDKMSAVVRKNSAQPVDGGVSGVRSLTVMSFLGDWMKSFRHLIRTACRVLLDSLQILALTCRSRTAVEAENLFLRKQLALFQERQIKPRRADHSTRWLMGFVSRWFDWRNALVVVKPETLIRWHRQGFRLFWRWKSQPVGRPRLPKDIQALIRQMAQENPTWGEQHIANELKVKLGIRVSPRTVGKYLAQGPRRKPDPSQRWLTFVRIHAQTIVACDFFVVVTARFRILYVFVLMELGRRKILHVNVTDHPSAEWTQQQLREALPGDHVFRFLIHDRDSIFSQELDQAVAAMGVRVLRTPPQSPQANSVCERLIGTIRRECLDFLIPLGRRHLKDILNRWVLHYNHGRVHMRLGPGIPAPTHPSPPQSEHRHRLPQGHRVRRKAVLGGLHHEYWLEKIAA